MIALYLLVLDYGRVDVGERQMSRYVESDYDRIYQQVCYIYYTTLFGLERDEG